MTAERKDPRVRISLDDIPGDWATFEDYRAWTGLSRNGAYEALRRDPVGYKYSIMPVRTMIASTAGG